MKQEDIQRELKSKIEIVNARFQDELKKLRTGRANSSMLDGVMVEAYGTQMPLIQVASIATPEAQLLQVSPFDPGTVQAVANAIRNNPSLGLNPTDDGRVVRVPIPALTEERRRDLVKQIGEKFEEAMIAIRNARHDALKLGENAKKDKNISEDDYKRLEKQVDDSVLQAKNSLDQLAKAKEADVMKV